MNWFKLIEVLLPLLLEIIDELNQAEDHPDEQEGATKPDTGQASEPARVMSVGVSNQQLRSVAKELVALIQPAMSSGSKHTPNNA